LIETWKEDGRMKLLMLLVVVVVLAVGFESVCGATVANQTSKFVLHIEQHAARSCAEGMPSIGTRDDLERVHDTCEDIDVFFVIFGFDSLRGVQYGLVWPEGWGSASTTHCADFAVGSIVNPGDGMAMTWSGCQLAGAVPAFWPVAWSWLLPASEGQIQISNNPATDALTVSSCSFEEAEPESVFFAGVNTDPYEGPPGDGVGIEPTSWGQIKAMFR
jgi:hypothetical protein